MASIIIYLPEQEPLEVPLDGYEQLTIGRAPENDLPLDHVSLSGSHAVLVNLGGAFQVQDLGSTNGTFVNGDAVSEAVLSHGAHVQFGAIMAVFKDEASAGAEAAAPAGGGSGYSGGHHAEIAESSNRPAGFSDLSPIEKVAKKDPLALVATLVGVVALLAAIALAVLSATMQAA